jgi:uncharacterized protein
MNTFKQSVSRHFSGFTKNKTSQTTLKTVVSVLPTPVEDAPSTPKKARSTPTITMDARTPNKTLPRSPLDKTLPNTPNSGHSIASIINTLEADYPLFDLDLLGIKPADRKWFTVVNIAVREFMNALDASHNYQHIRRVVSNAMYLLVKEKKHHEWARTLDPMVIWVACMTHDVGDAKYRVEGETRDQNDIIDDFLRELDCPLPIRRQAAYLAARVSFTAELRDEKEIAGFADEYPAFRIVQDADRLDGLGAVGVSRLFLYGGVNEVRRQGLIDSGIELIENRFSHYPRLMKTETSRKMAEERYKWMVDNFADRWRDETDTSNV